MAEWRENDKGNYVYVIDTDSVMTVFRRRDGDWAGAYDDRFTKGTFDTAEDAMQAMEPILQGDMTMLKPATYGWVANKGGGGFHLRTAKHLTSVKQSKSGSWFVIVDGQILDRQWFKTADEAKAAANKALNEKQKTTANIDDWLAELD